MARNLPKPRKGAGKRLFLSFFLACLSGSAPAAETACGATNFDETARVAYVHDGDTVHLVDGRKLRLIGIDAPELARNQNVAQPFAIAARDYLRQQVKQHANRVGLVYDRQREDKYGRTLAYLYFENGESVQAAMISAGLAVTFTTPPDDTQGTCFRQMETPARQSQINLWKHSKYQAQAATGLVDGADGFHILRARVLQVRESNKDMWLTLEAGLEIQIPGRDMKYFDHELLESLPGKTIEVRGWLHPKRRSSDRRFYLQLRHPDNFLVI